MLLLGQISIFYKPQTITRPFFRTMRYDALSALEEQYVAVVSTRFKRHRVQYRHLDIKLDQMKLSEGQWR